MLYSLPQPLVCRRTDLLYSEQSELGVSNNRASAAAAAAAAKFLQSCPTLCDPIDRLPPGSSVLNVKHLAQCLVNKGLMTTGCAGNGEDIDSMVHDPLELFPTS